MMAGEQYTPMIRQYLDIKKEHQDAILMFRLGDFYEMFFEDAKVASKILDIALTSRNKNEENSIPLCGVPYHSVQGYISKLVQEGHTVAICDQVEDPALATGIVKREVTRIVTPGLVTDPENLLSSENNYLLALCPGGEGVGMGWLDISTGDFQVAELSRDSVAEILSEFKPSEIILPESFFSEWKEKWGRQFSRILVHSHSDWAFDPDYGRKKIYQQFRVTSLSAFQCEDISLGIGAIGAILDYAQRTQKVDILSHVTHLKRYERGDSLVMTEETCCHLDLLNKSRDDTSTLVGVLDATQTSMGRRLLNRWIRYPLIDLKEIEARLDVIDEMRGLHEFCEKIRSLLLEIYDFERLNSKLSLGHAHARDLVHLSSSLSQLPLIDQELKKFKSPLLKAMAENWDGLEDLCEKIGKTLVPDPPLTLKEGGMIAEGFSQGLDELREVSRGGKGYIAALEARERERTKISSLKVRFNRVFGYYIEVTKTHLPHVPEDYIRKQTLANAERFITPELKEYENKVLGADDKIKALEYDLFLQLRNFCQSVVPRIQIMAQRIATLDVLCSLARISMENNYVRPVLDHSMDIEIHGGRHPVIEQMDLIEPFISNDVFLGGCHPPMMIITGPNMAGKSTVMRQVGLIVILAQMGSFVPARSARIGLVDKLFTRVGAQDRLAKGASTFMVEMSETAAILHHATEKSLILLDEIGRGTSTFDGISIAWAVAEHLHDVLRCRTMFATHYHELTDLALTKSRIKNYNMAVQESDGDILFLRQLVEGGTSRSYGIHVARHAGIPQGVVDRAFEILGNLEQGELNEAGQPRLAKRVRSQNNKQIKLF